MVWLSNLYLRGHAEIEDKISNIIRIIVLKNINTVHGVYAEILR